MSEGEQVERAIRAATDLARRLGAGTIAPTLLNASNNISVLLSPLPIVARVFARADDAAARAARELAVCRHLVDKRAPVVPPSTELPAGPHAVDGLTLTLWQFVEHRPADDADSNDAAVALRKVHAALADCPVALPAFGDTDRRVRALLDEPSALPALAASDRAFLRAAHSAVTRHLAALPMAACPLHGDAYLGNVLIAADGPRWTDFETACLGPPEWDIGFLPDADPALSGPVDRELYDALAELRSICVAVWCFARYDLPDKREAADYHLAWLKQDSVTARLAADS
jgi:aminoglycoside phosphotransferase (APT) family kinase protein